MLPKEGEKTLPDEREEEDELPDFLVAMGQVFDYAEDQGWSAPRSLCLTDQQGRLAFVPPSDDEAYVERSLPQGPSPCYPVYFLYVDRDGHAFSGRIEEEARTCCDLTKTPDQYETVAERLAALQRLLTDTQAVKLKQLPTAEFLRSDYWRIVTEYVTARDGKCTRCASTTALRVRPLTAAHRGEECRHVEDLVTLCETCHAAERRLS